MVIVCIYPSLLDKYSLLVTGCNYLSVFTIPPGTTCKEDKPAEQGVTIFTIHKLNDVNAEKAQPSGDLNSKQHAV